MILRFLGICFTKSMILKCCYSNVLWFINQHISFFSNASLLGTVPRARDLVEKRQPWFLHSCGWWGQRRAYDTQGALLCRDILSVRDWGWGHQPSLLGRLGSRNVFPGKTGRESIPTREGGTDIHCFPSGENSKCKGPGARVGEGVHGISGELKRGPYELM